MNTITEKSRENRARRRLDRMGYGLQKSRVQNTHMNDLGGYRIVDVRTNFVVEGAHFDLELDFVEAWIADQRETA